MGIWKIFTGILFLNLLSFALQIEYQNKGVELTVPKKSIVTIELPCRIKALFTNDLVQSDYNENALFVSVGEVPTSVGVSCEKDGVYRSYSFYFFPTTSGDVFFRVKDPALEQLVVSKEKKINSSAEDILDTARYAMKNILKGQLPQGFSQIDYKNTETIRGFKVSTEKVYLSSNLIAYVVNIENTGYIQKQLTEDTLFTDNTVMVWLEKKGYIKHGEKVKGVIIKTRGKPQEEDSNTPVVIPYK